MHDPAVHKTPLERSTPSRVIPFGMLVASIAREARSDHDTARQLNDLFANGDARFASPSHTSLLAFFEARP